MKFINAVSCGSWLKRQGRKKHKFTGILLAFQSRILNNRLSQSRLSASRKERTFGETVQVLVNMLSI